VTYDATRALIVAAEPPGPPRTGVRLPFTAEAKKVLELALREALGLGHSYIGTEHLLLGFLRGYEQMTTDLLPVNLGLLRTRVVQYASGTPAERSPRSPALHSVLGRAQGSAGDEPVTTGHVLAAMAADPDSQAAKALEILGVTDAGLAAALAGIAIEDTTDASGPPRWLEIRLGGRTTTIEDPELARVLHQMDTDALRALLHAAVQQEPPGVD
jgi:ATP-dependent Clp protease ATP-binding subunit ClpA